MQSLPEALVPLAGYRQFILYRLIPDGSKTKKLPVNPLTLKPFTKKDNWQQRPDLWVDAETAFCLLPMLGPDHGVGFFFTAADPFFFVDLDDCATPDGSAWNETALALCARFPGAAIEVSQSGRGLHIFGRTQSVPTHGTDNKTLKTQLYTERRFVALTGSGATGSADVDHTAALAQLVADFYPPVAAEGHDAGWTSEPVDGWSGLEDDDKLIEKALATRSAASAFDSSRVGFRELWEANADALAQRFPDDHGAQARAYDESQADAALAQHLAFWTGKNCERIERLMRRSGLVRDKWDARDDYLERTILRAVSLQRDVYSDKPRDVDNSLAQQFDAPKLRGTDDQVQWAEAIRAQKLLDCQGDVEAIEALCGAAGPQTNAGFWIDNREQPPEALITAATPVEHAAAPMGPSTGPELVTGYQFLGVTQQLEHFAGCIYVQDQHKVFTPSGVLLNQERFNAVYGGYTFQLEADGGGKTTRKAWEAFTESQAVRYPKAETTCFRPKEPPGALLTIEGRPCVNIYVPVMTARASGDVAPFLDHLKRTLPDQRDRDILLAYMAACIQYKGHKFQWSPLLQGAPGNGKTLFTRCVAFAIGERYTHLPPASEIGEKFNDWLFERLFIGVEDVYFPEHKREIIETLKPMITNERLAKRAMQQGQVMADVTANFILNSNHKDAIRKTLSDRRFAVFFTAQQTADDIIRDGMGGNYFPNLYNWLKGEGDWASFGAGYGYAVVAQYLENYAIPDELNPAGECHRAPETSSTGEAVAAGLGHVEQEVLEAVEEGRPGFAGGWISSFAFDRLLEAQRLSRAVPRNRRRGLLQSLGYDWHPGLQDGRVNNPTVTDAGKPRLFIKSGHLCANLMKPAEIVKAYDAAQQPGANGLQSKAEQAFG